MSTVNPITRHPVTPGSQGSAGPSMGKDDFLKVLVAQMQHMDPLNTEGGDQEFIGQMTQFSMLEQVTNLTKANEGLARASQMNEAVGLMGKTVSWKGEGEQAASGKVERVVVEDGKAKLVIAGSGEKVDPAKLTEVR